MRGPMQVTMRVAHSNRDKRMTKRPPWIFGWQIGWTLFIGHHFYQYRLQAQRSTERPSTGKENEAVGMLKSSNQVLCTRKVSGKSLCFADSTVHGVETTSRPSRPNPRSSNRLEFQLEDSRGLLGKRPESPESPKSPKNPEIPESVLKYIWLKVC